MIAFKYILEIILNLILYNIAYTLAYILFFIIISNNENYKKNKVFININKIRLLNITLKGVLSNTKK